MPEINGLTVGDVVLLKGIPGEWFISSLNAENGEVHMSFSSIEGSDEITVTVAEAIRLVDKTVRKA